MCVHVIVVDVNLLEMNFVCCHVYNLLFILLSNVGFTAEKRIGLKRPKELCSGDGLNRLLTTFQVIYFSRRRASSDGLGTGVYHLFHTGLERGFESGHVHFFERESQRRRGPGLTRG